MSDAIVEQIRLQNEREIEHLKVVIKRLGKCTFRC